MTLSAKSALILLGSAIAFPPAILPAETASLEICNNGHLEIDVAVAARIQYVITGYRWKSAGDLAAPAPILEDAARRL